MLRRCALFARPATARKAAAGASAVAAAKAPRKVKSTEVAAPTRSRKRRAPETPQESSGPKTVCAPPPAEAADAPAFTPGAPRSLVTVLDGHAFLYRAFHVYDKNTVEADKSEAAAAAHAKRAVRGHIGQAFSLRPPVDAPADGYASHEVAVCLDGGRYARLDVLPEYKSNREDVHRPDSDAFIAAGMEVLREIPRIRVVPKVRGMHAAEADDLIYTIVRRAARAGNTDCIVITHDKDLYQLMSAKRRVFFHGLRDGAFVSEADVVRKMGVRPDQIGDYLAIVGDKVDMIPGITGLGGKRAARLLQEYGTLEGVYEAAVKAKGAPLGRYIPVSATANVINEIDRARRMRDEVIALREVNEPFDGYTFQFEELQAAVKRGALDQPI